MRVREYTYDEEKEARIWKLTLGVLGLEPEA
jgi:hypothetical protein